MANVCPECGESVTLNPVRDIDFETDLDRNGNPFPRKIWFISWHEVSRGTMCGTDYASKRQAEAALNRAAQQPLKGV